MAGLIQRSIGKTRRLLENLRKTAAGIIGNTSFPVSRIAACVADTRVFEVAGQADVEVHSLLCHQDIWSYVIALKSFLRFFPGIAVVVHEDGTLLNEDIKLLRGHFQGIRIIKREEAEEHIKKKLSSYPYLLKARADRANLMQTVDFFEFADPEKIISFDADLLFFRCPEEVSEWVRSEKKEILYNSEEFAGASFYTRKEELFNAPGDFPFELLRGFNSGFVCMYRGIEDYALLESYLKYVQEAPRYKSSIIYAQNLLGLLVKSSGFSYKELDRGQYKVMCGYKEMPIGFRQASLFKHYNHRYMRFRRSFGYINDIRDVARNLRV